MIDKIFSSSEIMDIMSHDMLDFNTENKVSSSMKGQIFTLYQNHGKWFYYGTPLCTVDCP